MMVNMTDCPGYVMTPWGEPVWTIENCEYVFSYARSISGIILGGDVLTPDMKYTRDNWYFQPSFVQEVGISKTIEQNVEASINRTKEYILRYCRRNGPDFIFTFVIKEGLETTIYK